MNKDLKELKDRDIQMCGGRKGQEKENGLSRGPEVRRCLPSSWYNRRQWTVWLERKIGGLKSEQEWESDGSEALASDAKVVEH